MQAMTIMQYQAHELTPAQAFKAELFNDFVAWIDRGAKTTRSYLTNLRQFMAWLKYSRITDPERKDIVSYRDWLTVEHDAICLDAGSADGWAYRLDGTGTPLRITCKPNTVAQYLRIVFQFFRWTAANNLYPNIAENVHAPKLRHERHKKNALNAAQVLTIERSIAERAAQRTQEVQEAQKDAAGRLQRSTEQGARLFAMYMLTVNAGLRTVEISRANVRDLEIKDGQAWLYVWGKGCSEAEQKIALAPEVAAAIREYLQTRTDKLTGAAPLFASTGNRSGGKRIAPTTISTMLKRAMQAAGFDSERLTAHSLRHSAAQAALTASGNNVYVAQKHLRHSSPATTEIYLHEDENTEKAECAIAQDIFNLYHGTGSTDTRAQLDQITGRMNAQQLARLATIAAAML